MQKAYGRHVSSGPGAARKKKIAPRSGMEHISLKNRRKKVARWKEMSKYKSLLKREPVAPAPVIRDEEEDTRDEEEAEPIAASSVAVVTEADTAVHEDSESKQQPPSGAESGRASKSVAGSKPLGGAALRAPKAIPAEVRAHKQWKRRAQEVEAEREAERKRMADRAKARQEATKRRQEDRAKLNKRTKRGQPILGNQVEHMLRKLQG